MANPFYGEAEAKIGGKPYRLVFNFGAMAAMENHPYGRSFQLIAQELAPNADGTPRTDVKVSTAALLLWGCLRAKHSTVSFDDAGAMLLGEDAQAVTDAMLACLAKAFPEGDDANPPKRAKKAGAGTAS